MSFLKTYADLEYFTNRNKEFEEKLEEAEVWYLTYLKKIEQEAKEIKGNASPQDSHINEQFKTQSNIINLFKNLSSDPRSDKNSIAAAQLEDDEIYNKEIDKDLNYEELSENRAESFASDSVDHPLDHKADKESEEECKGYQLPASKLDIEAEFYKNDYIDEEPELNVAEHLPDIIAPGVWLEIYQGEDKAKRRLKFIKADIDNNNLVFSDRSGDYSFEVELKTFLNDLSAGRNRLISESNRFDLALSSVISNIRSNQDNA